MTLQWRHNEHDGISNHRHLQCLLNYWFRPRSNKTPKLRVTGLCAENSPVTSECPAQKASNVENVPISWRHHGNRAADGLVYTVSDVQNTRGYSSANQINIIYLQPRDLFYYVRHSVISTTQCQRVDTRINHQCRHIIIDTFHVFTPSPHITLLVLRSEYSEIIGSALWLLMAWLVVPPRQLQPGYWICRRNGS